MTHIKNLQNILLLMFPETNISYVLLLRCCLRLSYAPKNIVWKFICRRFGCSAILFLIVWYIIYKILINYSHWISLMLEWVCKILINYRTILCTYFSYLLQHIGVKRTSRLHNGGRPAGVRNAITIHTLCLHIRPPPTRNVRDDQHTPQAAGTVRCRHRGQREQDLRTPDNPVRLQSLFPCNVYRGACRESADWGDDTGHWRARHGAAHRLCVHVHHHGGGKQRADAPPRRVSPPALGDTRGVLRVSETAAGSVKLFRHQGVRGHPCLSGPTQGGRQIHTAEFPAGKVRKYFCSQNSEPFLIIPKLFNSSTVGNCTFNPSNGAKLLPGKKYRS